MKYYFITACILLLYITPLSAQKTIPLNGKWNVQLDAKEEGIKEQNYLEINLPGTLTEAGYGEKTVGSDFGVLTPTHKYVGVAYYERDIEIPKKWKHKDITVFLERVLWESQIFIDGKKLTTQDALGTPHIHNLGKLKPGKHKLSIRVNNDMIHNIGDKGHAYGEYTQSIWNGIVGKMELQAKDPTHIESVRTFSLIDKDQLKIELQIEAALKEKAEISIEIIELESNSIAYQTKVTNQLEHGKNTKEVVLDLHGKLKKWSEFNPCVYNLNITLKTRKSKDTHQTEFGFVQFSHDGTKVTVNGQPVFLRGNLDCVHFPLTGYPSTKVEDWMRIFKIYKDYGLNHVRFHTWCPPEAAFKAANRMGIYIQAEASIWIDWWMSEDMIKRGRPEMDTKGHPKGLGKDPERDKFAIAEMNRVVDFYGNNPSFTMFCIGNELGNADFDVMQKWIADLKKKDSRILYATSTARKIMDVDDYMVTHYIPNIGRTRGLNGPHTDWDFEEVYSRMNIPIIAHEIGQWPVYPSWKEIDKYTGVLKARNFEEFKAVAEKNGIVDQDEDFKMASGALNQIMYKYETESFLRTKSCAGVQLLSIQDYQGQGEALIGWLDAHWDSKGITTPEKFKQHFDETVPLLRMKKFIWSNDETFQAKAQLSHHGNSEIKNGEIAMTIQSSKGDILKSETWSVKNISISTLEDLGNITFPLSNINKAEQLTVSLQLKGTPYKNEWNIWVYPTDLPVKDNDTILVTEELNDETLLAIENGASVLLIANNLGNDENSTTVNFYPLYWSLTFFPGQGKTSIGMLLKDKHPAFNHFPTSFHSDWQWETFKNTTKGFILNSLPTNYKPIAQVVDDFHRNNKEGAIFEFKVGKGKLLVSGFDINNEKNIVAKQLKYSLTEYMKTNSFAPTQKVDLVFLRNLFPLIPRAEKVSTNSDFKNAILNVNAGEKLLENETSKPWSNELDEIIVSEKTKYKVKAEGVWKDNNVTAWHGENMTIEISCPSGILGSFYVQFNDWNNKEREGFLEFEGRKLKLGKHDGKEGKWVKFHVMREDSNDGKLILKTNASKGGNLMISKIVLSKE
ncbi:glycoside hydrolase family 2 [Wocania ichthyoenteri]|uniref:glycoside hydrolase family 2 n=1 Tax=Wocania ichthyoenteri TaxID=1230531 RepID=UPI00053D2693|nr:glycoside hydrolase family 2 [Wocania ichthyoenteri]